MECKRLPGTPEWDLAIEAYIGEDMSREAIISRFAHTIADLAAKYAALRKAAEKVIDGFNYDDMCADGLPLTAADLEKLRAALADLKDNEMSEPIIKAGWWDEEDVREIVVFNEPPMCNLEVNRRVVVIDEETALNDPNLKEKIRAALKK